MGFCGDCFRRFSKKKYNENELKETVEAVKNDGNEQSILAGEEKKTTETA